MRVAPDRSERPAELRRRIEALDGLPLRPASVRAVLASRDAAEGDEAPDPPKWADLDPGIALARLNAGNSVNWLELVAGRPWWNGGGEAVERVWRISVAVACAARRLATESGRPDPDVWARRGLLHHLGLWALAALAPDRLATWLELPDRARRVEAERAWLGTDLGSLGRTLAEEWTSDPILADAAWLHGDRANGLAACASDPDGLALIQRAVAWAERTPWALSGRDAAEPAADPRQRLLIAEVQIRCGEPFVAPDASPHEERLACSHARLHLEAAGLGREVEAHRRFLRAFSTLDPSADLDAWADRAALAWCSEPGVASARVDWTPAEVASPPTLILGRRGPSRAEVRLQFGPDRPANDPADHPALDAWHAWADLMADRRRLADRLEAAVEAHRRRAERQEEDLAPAKLEALAEFAAGAGHELNNPLAVIQGRAQLLLARVEDPEVLRSLRTIVGQAQRAHRMLRDLLYVARPPAPRPRPCQPDELLRAGARDLQAEADARGVRLLTEAGEPAPWAWVDPDPLRHLAEVLTRNALEATPPGGTVRLIGESQPQRLDWTVRDDGRGIDVREGRHVLDPFFCGRQAGRGLGMGLPRAARFVASAGGELTWRSAPGRGASFHVRLPLGPLPDEAARPPGP